jgi:membrane protein implicated in regulation of membrane protease activity
VEEPSPGAEEETDGISVTGRQVVLVDVIDEDTAQVEVDGETFTVNEGETFSENFELVSVEGTCARFLFGDESFSLCEGEAQK